MTFKKQLLQHPGFHYSNIALLILSAFLVASSFFTLSFPHVPFGSIIPFSLIPLFIATKNIACATKAKSLIHICKRAALSFWFFGFIIQLISFFWITKPIIYFGSTPSFVAYFLFILISTLSSFYFCLLFSPFIFSLCYTQKYPNKRIFLFPLALTMTLFEIVIPRFFDWSFGTLLSSNLIFSQIESLFGFNTGSLFIFYTSLSLSSFIGKSAPSSSEGRASAVKLTAKKALPCSLLFLFVILFGFVRVHYLNNILAQSEKLRVAFVQPNFTFNSFASLALPSIDAQPQSFATMLEMSKQVIQKSLQFDGKKPDLLVWPESTAPDFFLLTPWQITRVTQLSRSTEVPFLIQAIEMKEEDLKQLDFVNAPVWSSSVVINSDGLSPYFFQKWIPMPFGEEVPLENKFPSIGKWYRSLFKNASKLERGTNYHALSIGNNKFVTPLICFDSIDQELSYLSTKNGRAHFFVNQANFVWMVNSNAGLELALLDQMRAIENGRSVVIASNTGPSLAFDPLGNQLLAPTTLLTQNINFVDIPLYSGKTLFQTVYNWPLVILGLLSLCYLIFITRNSYVKRHTPKK